MTIIKDKNEMSEFQQKLLNNLISKHEFIEIKKNFETKKTIEAFDIFFKFTKNYIKKKTKNLRSCEGILIRFSFVDHDGSIIYDNTLHTNQDRCINYYDEIQSDMIYNNYRAGYTYSNKIVANLIKDIFNSVDQTKQTGSSSERKRKAQYNMKFPKWIFNSDIDNNIIVGGRYTPQVGLYSAVECSSPVCPYCC